MLVHRNNHSGFSLCQLDLNQLNKVILVSFFIRYNCYDYSYCIGVKRGIMYTVDLLKDSFFKALDWKGCFKRIVSETLLWSGWIEALNSYTVHAERVTHLVFLSVSVCTSVSFVSFEVLIALTDVSLAKHLMLYAPWIFAWHTITGNSV